MECTKKVNSMGAKRDGQNKKTTTNELNKDQKNGGRQYNKHRGERKEGLLGSN